MSRYNGLSISLYSALANGIKLLAGPLTILFISKNLNSEEIGFYYTFFSLVAMQQLAELGLGHTLRQYIAHSYKIHDNQWTEESKKKIKSYINFGFKWFSAVALFMIIIVAPAGLLYYSDYNGSIYWLAPWLMLASVTALVTIATPVQILLEATQNQKQVYQAQSVAALLNSLTIWTLISHGAGLYTIPCSLIVSNIALYMMLSSNAISYYKALRDTEISAKASSVFKELWPLLSRVSIVWGVGFLFWNGFNLISFKIYDADYAGKVIFTITLARAGFGLAESFFSSQITVISYNISQGHIQQAKQYARKYQLTSISMLVIGYIIFLWLGYMWPDFFIVQKTVDLKYSISIFAFFVSTLLLITENNFIRCFKAEPFVLVSIFQGVMVPLSFYLANKFSIKLYLYPCILIIIISIIASRTIARRFLANRSFISVGN
ncbi:hypothetical protein OQ486_13080 [Plesiomonas shigelloides]|uniref:hypothetical protein n=1 Tax=Plesiomonas shigelloides TaxID=703 RepID=UPI00224707CE|nr:hypothetical protein [Plesiomonas shigelloides]MCX2534398.1 hypothetical protein [Plesiomonas shigelloides]